MVVTIKQLKIVFLFCLFSPVFCWAKTDISSIYQEVSNNRATLIDARQGSQSGETSVLGAYWVRWPQSTHELPMLFDQLASCLKGKKVYVFCYVGSWAGFVTDQLNSRGIETVNTGGYSDWELAEVPMSQLGEFDLIKLCF